MLNQADTCISVRLRNTKKLPYGSFFVFYIFIQPSPLPTHSLQDPAADIPKPDYGRITRNGNKYYVHIYENTLGPLPLIGFDKNKIVKVRALDDGHEVPISTLWVHSDYPDIAFVDLGPDPVLPDPVDYVLEVEMAE